MNPVFKIMLIDDEPLARKRLRRLLNPYAPGLTIIGEAANGDEAGYLIETFRPDLIFLDIQMPGRDVFEMLKALKHQPLVIFCTAYDQYALQAFDTYAVDYLLKPVEEERLKLSIEKLTRNREAAASVYEQLHKLQPAKKPPASITHKCGNKIIPVRLSSITYFAASDKYVNFYDVQGQEYLTDLSLNSLESKLDHDFIRISRSLIVNKTHVKELHKHFRGKFTVVINDVPQSRLLSGGNYNSNILGAFEL
jgi:two-component system LytT family response regulator